MGVGERPRLDEGDVGLKERLFEIGVLHLSLRCPVEERRWVGDRPVDLTGVCLGARSGVETL